ncbi:probable leucine-rich repeat receptor-like protein kinase At1g68400 [Cynara cardunculus var. scolymus]|uniref:Concanavalin A-like lectin/glucanase, subgroup n=1 Tax=Cynara cardunculus var. scolymus TaxID=59895 RepID=A0A103XSW9_CYNCS|nr:probable leucine-rich repeat receptor-like protein kinase At1g68400 [Cynara cardunculus var. scolymus]KVH96274.1 Concanavalin A-like lectin/glucanase, subgroup [Cynara cardunculus var. scolymus]
MAAPPPSPPLLHLTHFLLFLLLLFHLSLLQATSPANDYPDLAPLMTFKASSDRSNRLTSWNYSSDPCSSSSAFYGVSCLHNRVTRLVLEDLDLQGSFDSLAALTELRILSLKRNRFTGPIPDLTNLTSLKLLFLSYNQISGEFPPSLPSLFRLYRLDLSYNNFSGEIPATINRMNHLLTLRLEENKFSGSIAVLNLQNLQDFNISGNQISGEIPTVLSGFPESAFSNNQILCGFPLSNCSEPKIPGLASPVGKPANTVVSSSPSSMPSTASLPDDHKKSGSNRHGGSGKISTVAIIAIIVGDVLVLALVSLILYCYFWRNFAGKSGNGKSTSSQILEGEKIVYSSSPYPNPTAQSGFERGRMVFFEGARRFELEDLLRASAEMLGKGGFGTAYKAVLDDGNVVAVKRLKEAAIGGKREFEQQMEVLGRLRHPNVVSLKAYYFARDEKLLVYDYMSNGNLFWLLHGNRGPGRTPLDWTTRLKVAAGAARGLVFIHHSSRSLKLTHGNIKSTNILIDKFGNAAVSDFGLSAFAPPTTAPKSNGYRAPELLTMDVRKTTQKSDVYSFGVLLLELLTGKCPSVVDNGGTGYGGAVDLPRWVQSVVREEWTAEVFDLELMRYKDIEEEMVGLLQIAMSCTAGAPDQRPTMGYVLKMIEEMRGIEVSPSHEMLDSVSDSPSVSDDTCRVSE